MSNELAIWHGPNGISIPANAREAKDIVPFANHLTIKQRNQILAAFQVQAFDMAAEYAWKKGMVKLKETIATLGMKFIGEMLGRDDFDESTNIDTEVTDHSAIQLAEQLGVIGSTAALKLRQSNELITHFFSKDAQEELDYTTAFNIVKSSIQYILGEADISIAIEFSKFRDRLLNETLRIDDVQVDSIINSPIFYLRTVITILVSSIKNDKGAKLEHALANINTILPEMWENLGENDKWNIGTVYRDVTSDGNSIAAAGVKSALLKVNGFDYVPENLRSQTFIKAARQVVQTHFGSNNFYHEPGVIQKLSALGTTIPAPAFAECMQAYLTVFIGNPYGTSWNAAPIAYGELAKVAPERWYFYFEKLIQKDEIVLGKLTNPTLANRFAELLTKLQLLDFKNLPKNSSVLYSALLSGDLRKAGNMAATMYNALRPVK